MVDRLAPQLTATARRQRFVDAYVSALQSPNTHGARATVAKLAA